MANGCALRYNVFKTYFSPEVSRMCAWVGMPNRF